MHFRFTVRRGHSLCRANEKRGEIHQMLTRTAREGMQKRGGGDEYFANIHCLGEWMKLPCGGT